MDPAPDQSNPGSSQGKLQACVLTCLWVRTAGITVFEVAGGWVACSRAPTRLLIQKIWGRVENLNF